MWKYATVHVIFETSFIRYLLWASGGGVGVLKLSCNFTWKSLAGYALSIS